MFNPETLNRLEAMTDFVAFERLCCDLLAVYGQFQGIVPQGVGRIDGGKDAVLIMREKQHVSSLRQRIVFHFSIRKDYKKKLWEDLGTTRKNNIPADLVIFVTNRLVTPTKKDQIKADALRKFSFEIEIFDQEWLRIPLDDEFQRLRKDYFDLDYDPQVFHDLKYVLEQPERHPNVADFESGAYYRHGSLHDQIQEFLKKERRCLIIGKPGHGKTALAKAVGWETLSHNSRQIVFYISARVHRSCNIWLSHIKAFDHDWVTYILDDCHQAPEQVNALLESWGEIRKSKLLIISWPLDSSLVGPEVENYQEILKAVRVDVEPDKAFVGQIVEHIFKRKQLVPCKIGPLQLVVERCHGDLHILDFMVNAWLKQPTCVNLSDVPEESILEEVYSRYLGRDWERYWRDIVSIAVLSQFEISVESQWFQDEVVTALRSNAFVERIVESVANVPQEYLRFFHSTPAKYLIKAAYQRGILRVSENNYILQKLTSYVLFCPGNLFEVFLQLHRNGRDDLQTSLYSNKLVIEAFEGFVQTVQMPISDTWFIDFCLLVYGCWKQDGGTGLFSKKLIRVFKDHFGYEDRHLLFRSLSIEVLFFCLWAICKIDLEFVPEVFGALDYTQLGKRSHLVSIRIISTFIQNALLAKVSKENLNDFFKGLDFKGIGERSRDKGIPTIKDFLKLARQSGVSKENLNVFIHRLDFKGLGERSRDIGISTIRSFLQSAIQVEVSKEHLNDFCRGLDFKGLGERSCDKGISTIMTFLKLVRQSGVSKENLNLFCCGLDWRRIGRDISTLINDKPLLFEIHMVCSNPGIDSDMARKFADGIGLDAIRSTLNEPNAPDIIATLNMLLLRKCSYGHGTLIRNGVNFCRELWLSSFIGKACANVSPEQMLIQSKYLSFALDQLREQPPKPLSELLSGRVLELKQWNILIHNIKLADNICFRSELEPLLRGLEQTQMAQLLCNADMLNLGYFLSRFAPDTGDFAWQPSLPKEISDLNFCTKINSASLKEIAYPLLNLRFLNSSVLCSNLADVIDHNSKIILDKLSNTDLMTLDFFLWNLLTARDSMDAPHILSDASICSIILDIARHSPKNQEDLTALCGTLHLWKWPEINDLLPLVKLDSAIQHSVSSAKSNSIKLIRLTAGLASISPESIPARDFQIIQSGLSEITFSIEVPSHYIALEHVRKWIGTISSE